MISFPLDYGSQCHDAVIRIFLQQFLDGKWNLKGTGYPVDVNIIVADGVSTQAFNGTINQLLCNDGVEFASNDSDVLVLANKASFIILPGLFPQF